MGSEWVLAKCGLQKGFGERGDPENSWDTLHLCVLFGTSPLLKPTKAEQRVPWNEPSPGDSSGLGGAGGRSAEARFAVRSEARWSAFFG